MGVFPQAEGYSHTLESIKKKTHRRESFMTPTVAKMQRPALSVKDTVGCPA